MCDIWLFLETKHGSLLGMTPTDVLFFTLALDETNAPFTHTLTLEEQVKGFCAVERKPAGGRPKKTPERSRR